MPSPIAHVATGYFVFRVVRFVAQQSESGSVARSSWLLPAAIALSMLPDVDSLPGFFVGDLQRFHNQWLHSLFASAIVAVITGWTAGVASRRSGILFFWSAMAFVCYALHVLMDFMTVGRGVKLFWPLTSARYEFPISLFYGLRWSDGWLSTHHVWTVANELAFVIAVGLTWYMGRRLKRRE